MTCRWVMAAMTRARPPQRCHRKRSWENVRLSSSAQHMVADGAVASCLGCNFRSFAMRRHADDLGAIFGVCGKEAERKVSDRIISSESGFIGLTRMESLGGKIIKRRVFSGSSDGV